MSILSFEHSRRAMIVDFVFYGISVPALLLLLWLTCPPAERLLGCFWIIVGFSGAGAVEYGLHRFILHQISPFSDWHKRHHALPRARIGTPTIVSALLIYLFVFSPALIFLPLFQAVALTLGGVAGYLLYIVTHHATHHWRGNNRWLRHRRRWHALHHSRNPERCYGVSSSFWDYVLGSKDKRSS